MKKRLFLLLAGVSICFAALYSQPSYPVKDSVIKRIVLPERMRIEQVYISQDMEYLLLTDEKNALYAFRFVFELPDLAAKFALVPELIYTGKYRFKEEVTLAYSKSWVEGEDKEFGHLTSISQREEPNKTYYLNPKLKTYAYRDCFVLPSHFPCAEEALHFLNLEESDSLEFTMKLEDKKFPLLGLKAFEDENMQGIQVHKKIYEDIPYEVNLASIPSRGMSATLRTQAFSPELSAPSNYSLPLSKKEGKYTVPVSLNGGITLDFVVDLQSEETFISRNVYETLRSIENMKGNREAILTDRSQSRARLPIMSFDGRELYNVWVTLLDERYTEYALVLGNNVLSRLGEIQLDFRNGEMKVFR